MATVKKKQNLWGEELLKQALVPEDEQPTEVPDNWLWVYGRIAFDKMESKRPTGDYFRYIDIESIDNKSQKVLEPKIIAVSEAPSRASRKLYTGSTLFSLVRPYLRNIAYIDESLSDCIASTGFYVCRPSKVFNSRYLFYLMTSDYVVNGLNAFMKGDNSPSIRKDDIENFAYPLPPLAEQQRIVDRIESLFAKLDQAKELAQNALDSFETRKAAILHKAFTGELTAKWREEHGVGMDSWELTQLGQILMPMRTRKPNPSEEYFSYIDIDAIDNKVQMVREPKRLLVSEAPSRASRSVNRGDILFSLVRPYLKNIAMIDEEHDDCIASTGFYVCSCKPNVVPRFLFFLLCSQTTIDYYTNLMKGDNSPAIRKEDFEGLAINLPSIPEQNEIARILDRILDTEYQAKHLTDVLDQIDLTKKAILARAFRGELGANDPNEESALGLLKEVIMAQN
jgi:Restriction endonuclease S subunits